MNERHVNSTLTISSVFDIPKVVNTEISAAASRVDIRNSKPSGAADSKPFCALQQLTLSLISRAFSTWYVLSSMLPQQPVNVPQV